MSHKSPKREGWIPCEFAALHDCPSDDDYCPKGIKNPDDCEKYHRMMVLEEEETPEEFENWKRKKKFVSPKNTK